MKKKHILLIITLILTATLALLLSGCAGDDEFEGKNIVTFEVNGGTLNYGTSSTKTKVNFAYHPGTYIIDPTEFPNYKISRNGYNFTGWYTSAECKPTDKWDFTTLFEVESLTLYAGWEKAVKYTYSLYYTENGSEVLLGSYDVASGGRFEDWRNFAKRSNYTGIGYFSDAECTVPWDYSVTHPGGDVDLDIKVYVDYIEGEWELVDNFDKLKAALKSGNVYLLSDIDCGGETLSLPTEYSRIIEGNGYKIKNLTVNKGGTNKNPTIAIFQTLSATAQIRNVSFEDVTYNFFDIRESTAAITVKVKAASLAVNVQQGAQVKDVCVSGSFKTNYNGDLSTLANAFYYEGADDSGALAGIEGFTANITVDKQS